MGQIKDKSIDLSDRVVSCSVKPIFLTMIVEILSRETVGELEAWVREGNGSILHEMWS